MKVKLLSRVRLLATPWTAAHQAPPSMGFSRQEYWSGVPVPSPNVITRLLKRQSHDVVNGGDLKYDPDNSYVVLWKFTSLVY